MDSINTSNAKNIQIQTPIVKTDIQSDKNIEENRVSDFKKVYEKTAEREGTTNHNVVSKKMEVNINPKHEDEHGAIKSLPDILSEVELWQNSLDRIMLKFNARQNFSPQEILSMQSKILKITRQIELSTKVIEQVVSGLKSIYQMQV